MVGDVNMRKTSNKSMDKTSKQKSTLKNSFKFLGISILMFIIFTIIDSSKTKEILHNFNDIIIKLIPTVVLIIVITFVMEYFLDTKKLIKYLGKHSGLKGWIIAILGGILSSGPMYVWYPLLKDLKDKGMKTGLIATFLYNRAIKIPLIPIIITYFGLKYSVILLITMGFASILQGFIIQKLIPTKQV